MSTMSVALKNTLLNQIDDAINTVAAGYVEFQTAGNVEVATCTLQATAFGSASAGTMVLASANEDTSATGGTMAYMRFFTSASASVITFTVGTAAEEIVFSTINISAGDRVGISSFTIGF